MKREIKFRAWHKRHKVFYYLTGFTKYGEGWFGGNPEKKFWEITFSDGFMKVSDDEIELMQFTGLKDKNGKEIYEGDIVNIEDCELIIENGHSPDGPDERMIDSIVSVFYEGSGFYFIHPNSNTPCPLDYDEMGKIEIIGNIYENPELL